MTKNKTILIIDDEIFILKMLTKMLNKLGYETLTASDKETAYKVYNEKKEEITGVLLDLKIPRTSGKEIFQILKKINNNVKVIISSGYGLNNEVQEILDLGASDFCNKPFEMADLEEKLKNFS